MDTSEWITIVAGVIGLIAAFLLYVAITNEDKRKQPKKPVTWYWEKRTDFTGKTYYFPKYKENHSCKCNHFKHERHDIPGQD